MTRFVMPALLLAALATVAVLVLQDDGGAPRPPEGDTPVATESEPERPTAERASRGTATVTERSERSALPAPAPDRAGGFDLLVRVVEDDRRTAVADARVWYLARTPENERRARALGAGGGAGVADLVQRLGTALQTDARGEARLPRIEEGLVVARKGSRTGFARISRGTEPPVLVVLHRTLTTVIETVDRAGRVVPDVPVGLRSGRRVLWTGRTREDGTVKPRVNARPDGRPIENLEAYLAFPHEPGVSGAVDLERPDAPVRLVVPATGSLEVWVDGLDAVGARRARVLARRPGDSTAMLQGLTENGRVLLDPVGVGTSLTVEAGPENAAPTVRSDVEGPRTAGQRVTVRLHLDSGKPVLVGRVVDERGRPMPDVSLDVSLQARTERSSSSMGTSLRTDGEGRFSLAVRDDLGATAKRTLDLSEHVRGRPKEAARTAHVKLPVLHPGPNDLGDVRLGAAPVVAAGVVVDRAGVAVENASVTVVRTGSGGDVPRARTDAQGRFVCRGVVSETEVRLDVSHPKYLPLRTESLPTGTHGLRLVLEGAGVVAGTVRLPSDLEPFQVRIALHRVEPPGEEARRTVRPDPDGSFRFESLRPGVVRVEVSLLGDTRPFLVADGVLVRSGETTRDPRLQGVSLASLQRISLRILDSDGRPVPHGFVAPVDDDATRSHLTGYTVRDGVVRLASTDPAPDVIAWAHGRRAVVARDVRDGQSIRLGPPLRVRFRVADGVTVPAPPFQLQISLARTGDAPRSAVFYSANATHRVGGSLPWERSSWSTVDRSGQAVVSVSRPGTYRVQVWVRNLRTRRLQPLPAPSTLRVADTTGEQSAVVRIRTKDLERAVRELR